MTEADDLIPWLAGWLCGRVLRDKEHMNITDVRALPPGEFTIEFASGLKLRVKIEEAKQP